MSKVKTIRFKGTLAGSGVVNYEGPGTYQYRINSSKAFDFDIEDENIENKNISLAKHLFEKKFIKNIEHIDGKIIISSNALRHHIFENSMPFTNRNSHISDEYLAGLVAHPMYLVRGYLELSDSAEKKIKGKKKGKNSKSEPEKVVEEVKEVKKVENRVKTNATIKRGRILTITHAVQNNDAIPTLGVATTAGVRDRNSLFYKELVGNITYEFKGSINLKNLMFIEMTDENDNLALHPDYFNVFRDSFKKNTGLEITENQVGYYITNGQAESIKRYGILLNKEQINYLIKYTLKEIAKVNIDKSTGFAQISSLSYMPITNPCMLSQSYDSGNFISVNSFEDIDALDIDAEEYYTKV